MENKIRYNHLNEYLKNKFGERTLKICIDGGFTCPNRDGTLSKNGCIFCSGKGSGEHINSSQNIEDQIRNYFESYKATRANKFLAYFQNFTNTYDTIENLRNKYNSALIDKRIVGLSIATRPDCINEDIVKLLKSYTDKYYVSVELGLQTSNEETGNLINRKYTNKDFSVAVALLNKYNIDVITHIMVGLPNETFEDIQNTVNFINNHNIQGLKIHSTYVVKNTKLADMYLSGTYTPISLEYFLNTTAYILTHISQDIVIHRVSGDSPKDLLLAPSWNLHKKWILNGLDKLMKEKDLWQGKKYNN
ncbi:MAG: TIGR01212 family radical SAM protein [Clostridia bacterium]|nr:TIGR01212 family radical SAM protein [Clostridia bacterium]